MKFLLLYNLKFGTKLRIVVVLTNVSALDIYQLMSTFLIDQQVVNLSLVLCKFCGMGGGN